MAELDAAPLLDGGLSTAGLVLREYDRLAEVGAD